MKLKKGDTVVVIAGKDKGKEGEVAQVFPSDNKVIVTGVNTAKKHQKARSANQQGGIIDRDMPIDAATSCSCTRASRRASATRPTRTARRSASPSAPER
jgi:ribosomal protein L24